MSPRHLLALWIGTLLASVAIGAAWPPPPLPRLSDDGKNWTLNEPPAQGRHNVNDMRTVTSDVRWAGMSTNSTDGRAQWRLTGILKDEQATALIVLNEVIGEPLRLQAGANLPDGSVLTSVQPDQIQTRLDGCTTTYKLFHQLPASTSGQCEQSSDTDQGKSK